MALAAEIRDRRILYVTAFLRALVTSATGVLLGLHLGKIGLTGSELGTIITSGLLGAALAALAVTLFGDRIGRRRSLISLSLASIAGTCVFAALHDPRALALAAFFGMLNGMGKDRGAALTLEQAALPATTSDAQRTQTIAFYTMLQDMGHALGALLAGVPALLVQSTGIETDHAHRAGFFVTALLTALGIPLYLALGKSIEAARAPRLYVSPKTRGTLLRLCALFSIDSLAGGFLTTSMLSYFFFERFHTHETVIATLFFAARSCNAVSHLGAAWLAKRIGLVNTMVFTHIPSSILLASVAFAPNFPIAALLFLLREGLVEMDVPTRQSYVMAVVAPEERTIASGITNLVRVACWSIAPAFAGLFMQKNQLFWPLLIGSSMKITYDILLYAAFRHTHPPEEQPT